MDASAQHALPRSVDDREKGQALKAGRVDLPLDRAKRLAEPESAQIELKTRPWACFAA